MNNQLKELIHLFKIPDYYTRLINMPDEGYIYWTKKANEELKILRVKI